MNNQQELDMKIVQEVSKKGREYLFQLNHASYHNTSLKQNTWREIASTVGSSQTQAMKRWKALRSRYIQLNKQISGSAGLPRRERDEWLVRALDFLKSGIINESNNECSSETVQLSSQSLENSNPLTSKILPLEDGSGVIIKQASEASFKFISDDLVCLTANKLNRLK